ncbi:transcription termination/antitermination protein NusG [Loigolactobacillus coryniformis]|jgi:transcriptional antiterminator NusG|uniref:transcription termination/antitermination protein NusG n=1 Tax=Loigolactobacillus coryniformis TaxID=1610 RepID=UPI001C5FDB91|nr:transcription termination/antitermination protein NusG [Loigolactobacillus coryniformis]MDT3391561.1 transcription termination/antitermination protein NusG [Bacillota bacterium]MBW4802020.1 transcription termination/antitermination protein NusG [Loigolactobacillus coryniformis subsp. torquens]MBW4804733.1 transcription termination/antitermination protein NusG [Loigolactobacillus coryniformis subsp. torquens]MCL5459277.1 transcription termination/antitermination protein NusG [Loigolactobacill
METESAEKQWYVLHTYSGYENKVRGNLESRAQSMGMENNIFRVVVPEQESREIKDGKEKVTMQKEFPGYVLVEMIMSDQAWFIVRNTPGVTGFVGSHGAGSKPAPLLPEEVERILRQLGMSARHTDVDFNVDDTVTIVDGAFSGLSGKITEVDAEKMKLKVNIDMFGRETSTELDYDQVDKI